MLKIWLKDRSAIDQGLLPYLLPKMKLDGMLTEKEYKQAQAKVESGDFTVEPDSDRGGFNIVFADD